MTRDIVVIGGSAGALGPLRSILHDVASDLPAAVFVVLHRGSHSHDSLVELLSLGSSLPVKAAKDGDPIVPGTVCIAPPDEHLVVKADRLKLTRGPRENQWRPAIDVLFRSAAVA
jgi:two-component system chemotaxis response regulator CheB